MNRPPRAAWRRAPFVATSLALFWSAPAVSQEPPWCALEGMRIRVHTTSEVAPRGVSLGCSGQSLLIRPDDPAELRNGYVDQRVPFFDVRSVDVSRGIRRPVVRSIAIGSSIVGGLFGGFSYLTGNDGAPCSVGFCVRVSRKRKVVAGFIAGILIGAGGGLLKGLNNESDIWEPWPDVPLRSGQGLTLLPTIGPSGAVGSRVSFRF